VNGIILTQAALHAIIGATLADMAMDRPNRARGRLETLEIALDPAHAEPAQPQGLARRLVEDDFGGTRHAPPVQVGAGGAGGKAVPGHGATASASNGCAAEAGTPAPPTMELPSRPANGAPTSAFVRPTAAGAVGAAPEAPPPARGAVGHHTYRRAQTRRGGPRKSAWTPAREALLRLSYPTCTDGDALLAELNALPAETPIASVPAMGQRAAKLGVRRTAETLRAVLGSSRLRGIEAANAARLATLAQSTPQEDRAALLRRLWGEPLTMNEIIDRLNEIDGPTILHKGAVYVMAKELGLTTPRHATQDAAPPPDAQLPPAEPDDSPAEPEAEADTPDHEPTEPDPADPPADAVRHPTPPTDPNPPARPANIRAPLAGGDLHGEAGQKAEVFDFWAAGQSVRDAGAEFGIALSTLSTWHAEWKLAQRQKETAA
jgi:hypothetical protein